MLNDLRWAYAAGVVDGEGCISIHRCTYSAKKRPGVPRYTVSIAVAMNDPEAIRELADLWRRSVRYAETRINGSKKRYLARSYCVSVTKCTDVAEILTRLLPYLRAKRSQAEVVLEACLDIQAHFHKHYVPDEVHARWKEQFERCRKLKTRNASLILPSAA